MSFLVIHRAILRTVTPGTPFGCWDGATFHSTGGHGLGLKASLIRVPCRFMPFAHNPAMPKLKIGEKQLAGEEDKNARKVFTNGHKSFTAMEAQVLTETQGREQRTVIAFEREKHSIMKPRNPLTGEATPRRTVDMSGDVVQQTGMLLLPQNRTTPQPATKTMKALQATSLRRVGGNDRSYPEEGNPLRRPDQAMERISSLQNLQDNMGGEIEYLRERAREQERLLKSMPAARWP